MSLQTLVRKAAKIIGDSNYVVVFTGAGISAEAGIPTFRGAQGLWTKYRPEELATPKAFKKNPKKVWEWYVWRLEIILRSKPTLAHRIIAELERRGIVKVIITQNVDELHQDAGSRRVIELHGSIRRARCTKCSYKTKLMEIPREIPPHCPKCGALLRPDVVWFGEEVPRVAFEESMREASICDSMIIIGTSGVVFPAAYIPIIAKSKGAILIEINPSRSALTSYVDIHIGTEASKALKAIYLELKSLGIINDRD
ncbi:MAG: NAD-dependent protein deacylase [Thermoprotei archaeon]|nr:MAG: NAD-dependent protein deacylase [Thermoprotei archaeon]